MYISPNWPFSLRKYEDSAYAKGRWVRIVSKWACRQYCVYARGWGRGSKLPNNILRTYYVQYTVPNHKSLSYIENLSKQLKLVVIILQLQFCMLALIPSKSNNSTHTNISEIGDLQVLCTRPRSNLKGVGLLSLLFTSDPAPSKGL